MIGKDMLSYTKSLESRHRLPVNYLTECRSRVTDEMRATLVNWLVEIHGHLKLEPETLHIAVKLLDATLHRFDIGVTRLQLCGLAVFWIASKLENNPLAVIRFEILSRHSLYLKGIGYLIPTGSRSVATHVLRGRFFHSGAHGRASAQGAAVSSPSGRAHFLSQQTFALRREW